MDVNGTRFQLLLGRADWANCTGEDGQPILPTLEPQGVGSPPGDDAVGFAWDDERAELTLKASSLPIITKPSHTPPRLSDRRGAARDRYGNWYWIDLTRSELLVNSVGTGNTTHFWSVRDGVARDTQARRGGFQTRPEDVPPLPDPLTMSGLTVTEDHYLVVGMLQPPGLLIFDLYTGGSPQQIRWPSSVRFAPFDMAPMPGGGVWILDPGKDDKGNKVDDARYWALDRHFNVIAQDQQEIVLAPETVDMFQPASEGAERRTAARTFPAGITLDAASPLLALDPIAIVALPDGTVLILDSSPDGVSSSIYRYSFSQLISQVDLATKVSFPLNAYDIAFLPEHDDPDVKRRRIPDQLYVVPAAGSQAFVFKICQKNDQLQLELLPGYYPMRAFGGKALEAAGNQVYYDFTDYWVPLVEQCRPRYTDEATLETPFGGSRHAFDGHQPDCTWHRLMLDATIPPETSIQVWSRAANDESDLPLTSWQREPDLYLRSDGSELPFVENPEGEDNGTWELLFQAASGRYLQLKLTLSGNRRLTPRLRALRAYYPRLHYLPAVYREDSLSASFLDRFLANIEGFYTTLEDKIAAAQMLFDARSVPADALQWLASWFGIALDITWDTYRQRLFIRHAADFFRSRGTICGLQMILRLTFDEQPDETIFTDCLTDPTHAGSVRIVEKFRTRQAPGGAYGNSITISSSSPTVINSRKLLEQSGVSFVPSTSADDLLPWQDFLTRRYRDINALNRAYQTSFVDFSEIELPQMLPPDGPALQDWYQFQTVVLPMRRAAHQFTVLLPAPTAGSTDEYQQRRELAQRIIELEKPAHTAFEVKFYVSAFCIGEARLGIDTLVDLGSRSGQLMAPMVLGQGYLLEGYLASEYGQNISERDILKREQQSER